jgi:flavin-binding protein dodecin
MSELHASTATMLSAASDDETAGAPAMSSSERVTLEFVGSSDETIAEAVRRALLDAANSLTTLDGAGVVVIPQIEPRGSGPRFHVTLRVSLNAPSSRGGSFSQGGSLPSLPLR